MRVLEKSKQRLDTVRCRLTPYAERATHAEHGLHLCYLILVAFFGSTPYNWAAGALALCLSAHYIKKGH